MLTLADLHPLTAYLTQIAHLQSASSVLSWDQETYMPRGGSGARAEVLATVQGLAHERFTAPEMEELLWRWIDVDNGTILDPEADAPARAVLREVLRDYRRAKRLPTPFVSHLERTCALAHEAWLGAREKRDYALFLPHLTAIVTLKREEAAYLGYSETAYDALVDAFEPGMTASRLTPLFAELKTALSALLARIMDSPVRPAPLPAGPYDAQRQLAFGSLLLSAMGYRFDHGRLDQSAHPFTTGFHPTDVRVTTRVSAEDVTSSLFSCLHEGGHGLYDQGLDPAYYGTPLGEAVSLGMHESQSRLWENCVGRSIELWRHFYPLLRQAFPGPLARVSLEEFHAAINTVKPSLIRVEADELTYNFHIIVRYELEQQLIAGQLSPADLPQAWNEAMHGTLGVTPRDDGEGVLQDIHWAHGAFGYFPTYTLGNLYAAQFWQQAQRDLADLPTLIEGGRLDPLVSWLRDRIHRWGRTHSSDALLRRITGEPLNPEHFMTYLEGKFGAIYRLA
ncbi:MAG: carboxypeptidase M32 [Nitrospirae bacterium]|nr:carboxypeptidase M32 [Nitrospirota bacterium]